MLKREDLVWMTVCAVTREFGEDPDLVSWDPISETFLIKGKPYRVGSDEEICMVCSGSLVLVDPVFEDSDDVGPWDFVPSSALEDLCVLTSSTCSTNAMQSGKTIARPATISTSAPN